MNIREKLKYKERIVVKVGTSSLSFPNGKMNYLRMEKLTMILADLVSCEKEIVLLE
jgi:glutamate 5-kinase